jgi:hypothetical protein
MALSGRTTSVMSPNEWAATYRERRQAAVPVSQLLPAARYGTAPLATADQSDRACTGAATTLASRVAYERRAGDSGCNAMMCLAGHGSWH